MALIDTMELKRLVEQRMDMQDTYLPVHFYDVIDELEDKSRSTGNGWYSRSKDIELNNGQQIREYSITFETPDKKLIDALEQLYHAMTYPNGTKRNDIDPNELMQVFRDYFGSIEVWQGDGESILVTIESLMRDYLNGRK
jgi:hypothetical protein